MKKYPAELAGTFAVFFFFGSAVPEFDLTQSSREIHFYRIGILQHFKM